MNIILNDSFVFSFALLCHGSILYENNEFLTNARLIISKNTQLGNPTFFNSIDQVMTELHTTFYKDISTTTQHIIKTKHKNSRMVPLFYDKILYYDPQSLSDTMEYLFSPIIGKNKYEDGIYLFSIHKKTANGLENIEFKNGPLNLMLASSWNTLYEIFGKKNNLLSLSSPKPISTIFRDFEIENHKKETSKTIFSKLSKDEKQKMDATLNEDIITKKRTSAEKYNFYMTPNDKTSSRMIEVKLSSLLRLLTQLNPNGSSYDKNFFNIYDFTCNGCSSILTEKEKEKMIDKFKDLDTSMQISYGGVNSKRYSKKLALRNKKKTRRYV